MSPLLNKNSAAVPRADFGRVTVFFGDKNGKYPDGNQVIVRGSDTQAAFDTPIVANRIGPEFDASELVILGHVHEDHMAGLHRLPKAPVHVHEADLAAARSWEGLIAAYGSDPAYVDVMLQKFRDKFFYAPRPDAIGYSDGAVWELGKSRVRAFHMPGHTAGHCALLVEPEGVAFIGDIDLSGFGPYYGDYASSLVDFRKTLAKVADVPAKVWVTSHHRGVYTDREKFLQATPGRLYPRARYTRSAAARPAGAHHRGRWRNWWNAGCSIRPAIRNCGWSMPRPVRSRCISPRCWLTAAC